MTTDLIDLQINSGIATIYLNRPEKRNAMSDEMRAEFISALERVAGDNSIRALVLTGNGKGFCAGGDVAGMQARMQAPVGEAGFNGWSRQQRVHYTVSCVAHDAQADDCRGERCGRRPGRRHGTQLRFRHSQRNSQLRMVVH